MEVCKVCRNTGMRPLSEYLDCTDCNSAVERAAFNKWRENELNSIGTENDDWDIHQRALAMAPKQEATEQEPVGMVAKSSFASHKVLVATTQLDEIPLGAKLYLAAPATANGALPELPKPETLIVESDLGHRAYTADQMRAYGHACHAMGRGAAVREYVENGTFKQPVVAAGPDAALIKALEEVMRPYGIYDVAVSNAGALQLDFIEIGQQARAALSGVKGN